MPTAILQLASLEPAVEQVVAHLKDGRDTALVAAPGCGATTLVARIRSALASAGIATCDLDLRTGNTATAAATTLGALLPRAEGAAPPQIIVIDHASRLPPGETNGWLERIHTKAIETRMACLWTGALDARSIEAECHFAIHALPVSHVTFPTLARDELIATYRSIGESKGCRWGEAILHLLVDLCGNDLALAESVTRYLYGDWSNRLYDVNIWDQIGDWLAHSPVVNDYRQRLKVLPEDCKDHLALLRLGGKPLCQRADFQQEVNGSLRRLCLSGFLVPNLLPGFYQLRNLTVRFLVMEQVATWPGFGPAALFRRATNERVGQLIQDVETMLRSVLLTAFEALGEEAVVELFKNKQCESEFMPAELNRALLEWATQAGGSDLKSKLNSLLLDQRRTFRDSNTVWTRVMAMMQEERLGDARPVAPPHLRSVEFLTFNELGNTVVELIDRVFPGANKPDDKKRVRERWVDGLSKVRRLRNQVAHLRNINFQDMEDLVAVVDAMRRDLVAFAGWRRL